MADSPSIVIASLSDDELKKSIDSLVTHVDEAMNKMVQSTNKAVGEMEAKLKSLGNLKIDTGGSNDGGTGRRTQQHEKLTKAVNDASEAVAKETQKLQDLQQSLSGASDREQNFISQKERAANTIAQENELLSKQQSELSGLRTQQAGVTQEVEKSAQASQQKAKIDSQVAAKEKEIAETKGRIAAATKEQSEADKNASQAAKEKANIQSQVANQEKQVAEAKRHLTTATQQHTDAETKSSRAAKEKSMTLGQQAQAVKETTVAYDNLQKAKDKAVESVSKAQAKTNAIKEEANSLELLNQKYKELEALSARRFEESPLQTLRMRQHELEAGMKVASTEVAKAKKDVDDLNASIEAYKRTLASLPNDKNGFAQRQSIQKEINDMVVLRDAAAEEQKKWVVAGRQISAQYENVKSQIREIGKALNVAESAQDKTATSANKYTEEIRKQAATQEAEAEAVKKSNKAWETKEQYMARVAEYMKSVPILNEKYEESMAGGKAGLRAINGEPLEKEIIEYTQLQKLVARWNGVKVEELDLITRSDRSYNILSESLKKMTTAYRNLTEQDRNSSLGKQLADDIQHLQRTLQKAQAQMSRPVDLKSALGLEEKTLDDITYKIRQLQSYKQGIDLTKPTAAQEIRSVDNEINRLNKDLNKYMGSSKQATEINQALGRSWNYMKNRLAFYLTVGASTAFVKNLIEVRSQYEMNERALGILVDSASRGTRIFNELSRMSLVSPYTLIELSSAAKQLTAFDIEAKDVVDTTRRLADMAAAVGAPVERLTYALGQIKAYGYLNSRDARMFANAGIPLVKQLAEYYSELEGRLVSTGDVYDRMKKKAIDFNAVMAVVNKMTDEGGKFFDFQAKMADTLKVRLANLTLAWNNMLNDIGKDAGGFLNNSIKSVTILFRHWRELSRALGTIVTAIGAYKTATWLAAVTTSASIGKSSVAAWLSLASSVRSAKDATALFSLTIKSIPFVGWVTAIASLVSWFYLFNQSGDEVKQKLQDIQSAFDGVRKEIDDLFADAIRTDSIGTQLTKLQSMLETAETELGVVIPINLEDVNESKIKQKLKEARNFIDTYLNFSQTFSEAAAGSRFNEAMNEFGSNARTVYTSITESINSVVVALQELSDKGRASKRDIEILNELIGGQKEDESRIEYLQRLVRLYEKLGLIGKEEFTVNTGFSAHWVSYKTNMDKLQAQQEQNINRLGIKNKSVFESMLNDVQGYYSSSRIALFRFEKQIERVAQKIDINSIPVAGRTLRLQVAINEEASLNNWNEFEKEYARQIANTKYGTQIEISSDSKKSAETKLQDWQKRQQEWMDNHGIKVNLSFQTDETEASYASRMLQEAKDAQSKLEIQRRKLSVGTGSQKDVDAAVKELNTAIEKARAAGADLSQLDKKKSGSKKDILGEALTKEVQLVGEIQKRYEEYRKIGLNTTESLAKATDEYGNSLKNVGATLSKYGIATKTPEELANMDLVKVRDYYKELLEGAKALGNAKGIEAIEKALANINVEIEKFSHKKIVDSLNNELGKLKDEYELAVELDATPEMSSVFMDAMGLSREDLEQLPRTYSQLAKKLQESIDKVFKDEGKDVKFDLENTLNDDEFKAWVEKNGHLLEAGWVDALNKIREFAQKTRLKEVKDTTKTWNELISKYGGLSDKLLKITRDTINEEMGVIKQFGSEEQIERAFQITDDLKIKKDPLEIARLSRELMELLQAVIQNNPKAISIASAITTQEGRDKSKAEWDEFKNSDLYTMTFENMDNLSVRAIRHIIDELENLKDKVKEDPASMKALMKSIEDAEKAFIKRKPFDAIINSLKAWKRASQEVKAANRELKDANKAIDDANAKKERAITAGDKNKYKEAQKEEKEATEKRNKATDKLTKAENKLAKAQANFNESLSASSSALNNVASLVQQVTDLMGLAEDSEAAIAINEMVKGLQMMATTLGVVATAAILVQMSLGWIAVAAAALGVLAGLIKWFVNRKDNKILKEIKASENTVKELEMSYKQLQETVEDAYGMMEIGAKRAAIENKKLQLEQLELQLQLQESRKGKKRDEEEIRNLRGQVQDLKNEIANDLQDITNTILGIESVGNAAETLVSSMIDAFRQGEDYMKVYADTFEDMIDNMIMKAIVGRVIGDSIEKIFDMVQSKADDRAKSSYGVQYWKKEQERLENEIKLLEERGNKAKYEINGRQVSQDEYRRYLQEELTKAQENYGKAYAIAATPTVEDVNDVRPSVEDEKENIKNRFEAYMELYGIMFGDRGDKGLSALQQGIQGITEDTAGAIESYMNIVSQRIFENGNILSEIRDAVVSFDMDIQLGTLSQMLLQLQASHQVQVSIQNILNGVLNPSGRAFVVELNN